MQTSHCKAAMRWRDLANDWLCQHQIFIPGLLNPTGFTFSWLLALLGIIRKSQVANHFPLKARFSWSWFQRARCALKGDGRSLQSGCWWWGACLWGHWDRAGLGGHMCCCHPPALSQHGSKHPHNVTLAEAFTEDPVEVIWGSDKSEGYLNWKKESVGGSWPFSKADKGDMTHKKWTYTLPHSFVQEDKVDWPLWLALKISDFA